MRVPVVPGLESLQEGIVSGGVWMFREFAGGDCQRGGWMFKS